MNHLPWLCPSLVALAAPALSHTVIVTAIPDADHPLLPVAFKNGAPLTADVTVRVGAFPDLDDDALLNTAAQQGLAGLEAAWQPFGETFAIGTGSDGEAGRFEVAATEESVPAGSPWVGEKIAVLITTADESEFLVVRFADAVFVETPDTGLEPLISLHLASAGLIVGSGYGNNYLATSPAPAVGAYGEWIESFPGIIDPALREPEQDADSDGLPNELEYLTGGNPGAPGDPPPCAVTFGQGDTRWVSYSALEGIGGPRPVIEYTESLLLPWITLEGPPQPDPSGLEGGLAERMRLALPPSAAGRGFVRLRYGSEPEP